LGYCPGNSLVLLERQSEQPHRDLNYSAVKNPLAAHSFLLCFLRSLLLNLISVFICVYPWLKSVPSLPSLSSVQISPTLLKFLDFARKFVFPCACKWNHNRNRWTH
jgi:hypothetical protein